MLGSLHVFSFFLCPTSFCQNLTEESLWPPVEHWKWCSPESLQECQALLNKYVSGLRLIFTVYYCSLFKQLKRMTWSLKNLLTIVLKSRILLECTLVSELNDTFLPWRKVGKSAFFHCFLTDTLEIKPTDPDICSSQTFVTLLTAISQSPVTFHPSPSNSNWN